LKKIESHLGPSLSDGSPLSYHLWMGNLAGINIKRASFRQILAVCFRFLAIISLYWIIWIGSNTAFPTHQKKIGVRKDWVRQVGKHCGLTFLEFWLNW